MNGWYGTAPPLLFLVREDEGKELRQKGRNLRKLRIGKFSKALLFPGSSRCRRRRSSLSSLNPNSPTAPLRALGSKKFVTTPSRMLGTKQASLLFSECTLIEVEEYVKEYRQ